MLTNSILGGNVYKFRVCLQALPIMALNHKLTSQSTLAWLRTVIVYPPKTRQKVIIKLNRRKDIRRILLNKNKLKNLKPESVNLWNKKKVKKKFSLMKVCACNTRNCGPNKKKLWGAGHISPFYVSNGSLRIKLSNESVSMITHDCDLKKLFRGNLLIAYN